MNIDQPILRAEGVKRLYGASHVLDDVSLTLSAGTLTLLTGRNGSGKSTFVNCLTGFDRDYEGDVFLFGKSVRGKSADERARSGIVRTFQYPHLFSSLTVRDHLNLGSNAGSPALSTYFQWRWRREPGGDILADALSDLLDHRGDELSFGEMKLVNTARAFMTGAKVLLLDEPLASLHGIKREEMLRAICHKREVGCAVMVIEHDIPELFALADSAYELREGHLLEKLAL